METVTDFIFLGSKITVDADCSHEIKRCLLLGRTAMTNLHSTLKSRDITLPTKVYIVKAMVFPVVMCVCKRVGLSRRLSTEDLMLHTVMLEKTLQHSLGQQGDQTSPS